MGKSYNRNVDKYGKYADARKQRDQQKRNKNKGNRGEKHLICRDDDGF